MKGIILIKNERGEYKTIVKDFKDKRHMDNYEAFMNRKGNKVIQSEKA